MGNDERPASILTNRQRNYLLGEKTVANAPRTKGRIRERIEYGLFDIELLFEYLEQEDLRKIFGDQYAEEMKLHEEVQGKEPGGYPITGHVPGAIAFLLRGLNYGDEPVYPKFAEMGEPQPAFDEFTEAVEAGIVQYLEEETEYSANVTVDIELSDIQLQDDFVRERQEKHSGENDT